MYQQPRPAVYQPQKNNSAVLTTGSLFLFLLFAFYGPSFSFLGQLRIVEGVLLIVLLVGVQKVFKIPNRLEWGLVFFTLITALTFVWIGYLLHSPSSAIILRSGTYLIMAAMLLSLILLSQFKSKQMILIIFGYCVSYFLSWLFFSAYLPNGETYALVPWRLGLGFAFTWGVLCLVVMFPRLLPLVPVLMLGLTLLHVVLGARSLALGTFACAILTVLALRNSSDQPGPFRFSQVFWIGVAILVFSWVALQVMVMMAEGGYLPEEMTLRMLKQYYSENGILVAARAPNYVAAVGITRHPIVGYGPGISDPYLTSLYVRLIAENLGDGSNTDALYNHYLQDEWGTAIPSHSHLLGAWIEAGIIGGLYWIIVMALVVYVLTRSLKYRNPWVPMYLFLAMTTLWDLVFSPGPHRVDIALRMMVFLFAVRQFKMRDAIATARRVAWRQASAAYYGMQSGPYLDGPVPHSPQLRQSGNYVADGRGRRSNGLRT